MKKLLIAGSAVLMLTFCCGPVVLAQSPIGTITYLEGVGDITRNDQGPVSLKENDEVFVNDRIRTKSYSKAQITFVDKSVLKLAPGSCVTIEEFKMSGGQKREFARCKLSRGKLEAIVSKTGRPETFVIDTPNAKGAVKGSDIFVSYLGGKTGIFVKEGALSVWNPALPDTKATIVKGNCAFVPFNEAPGGERSILDTEMLIHKRDVEHVLVKKWIPSKGSFKMNAVIVAVSGTVRIYKKEALDWKDAAMDEVFMEGDILQTAIDGQVSVRLNNGNVLFVAGNTELSVTTLRYDSKSGNYENTFTMSHGRVGAVVEKLGKESTFQIKTPTVVCGVRGTLVEVFAPSATAQEPAPQTQVFYEGGNGVVTSLLTQETQNVAGGEHVTVDVSGTISRPAFTTAEQRSGLIVNQQGALSSTGGLPDLNNPGSLVSQAHGSAIALAQASIAGSDITSLTAATENLEVTATLTFNDQTSSLSPSSSAADIIYSNTLDPFNYTGIGGAAPTIDVKLLSDNTWNAVITGGARTGTTGSWGFESQRGADQIIFEGTNFPLDGQWTGTITTGTVDGKTLTGTASGDVGSDPTSGPVEGSASGTWS